jgi:Major Facilitator Superfamily
MTAGAYRAVLGRPGAVRLLGSSLFGRMPVGMVTLATVLTVRAATGSYALAGAVSGAYAIANSLIAPVHGRLIDRFGQTRVLLPCTTLLALSLLGLAAGATLGAPVALLAVCAVLAGLGMPPLSASGRALWGSLLGRGDALRTAFALESTAQELIFILGPLLVGLCVTIVAPAAALVLSAALTVTGTLAFATSPLSRSWRAEVRSTDWAGAMRSPGLRTVVGVGVLLGAAVGLVEVSVAAFAERSGATGAAGVLLALWSVGSLGGGLWYGGRRLGGALERRYLVLIGLLAAGFVPAVVVGALDLASVVGLSAMGAVLVLAGVAIVPLLTCHYLLVDQLAPVGTVTEAFNWALAGFLAGLAGGVALGGAVIDAAGVPWSLAAAPLATGLAAGFATVRRATLRPSPPEPPTSASTKRPTGGRQVGGHAI